VESTLIIGTLTIIYAVELLVGNVSIFVRIAWSESFETLKLVPRILFNVVATQELLLVNHEVLGFVSNQLGDWKA
jgi:hypothetical protein